MKTLKPVILGVGAFIYSAMTFHTALADDTEIYVPKDLPADQQIRPNILFILDSSGSMDTTVDNSGGLNRNQVLKNVVKNLIDNLKTKENVNIGFMRFRGLNNNNEQGGHIMSPVQRLTNTNAASMKTIVDNLPKEDWTPLSETYYEAYRYMAGLTPVWGATLSAPASIASGKYISPVTHSCQQNHIIYVTDGEPTRDQDSNTAIRTLVNGKNTTYTAASCNTGHGQCLPHLAEYMAKQDMFPGTSPAQFLDPSERKQTVTSHFVGFAVDLPLLSNAAAAGGGKYYTSSNVSGLTDALTAIVSEITADNTSFAAPSVAVSAFNNLGYRNDLYYALFRPAEGTRWPGNVKRYKLSKDNSGNPLIVDKTGTAAIDDTSGFFSDSSSSFWSTTDGKDVAKGGVAAQLLNPDTRNVLTWTAADRTPTAGAGVTGSAGLIALNSSNIGSNYALVGATTSTERDSYINWARGKNTNNSARLAIGDVLHNEPKLIAYTTDEDLVRVGNSQKPISDPDYQASPEQLYMFFGDNEGFIHAINPNNGTEKFAFIPKELLKNPSYYFKDAKGAVNKKYGIDGQINLWTEYSALNTGTKTRALNKAFLYAGMRRGGSNYYALDVLNINAPTLKWVIKGPEQTLVGANYTNATTGFTPGYAKLGRTFSAPKLAKLKVNGVETKVLIFTGGYDLDQDNIGSNIPKNDDIGNSLFVANADTGELIWQASNSGAQLNISQMTNSMPADPTLIDINGDGLVDIAYASDLRGQVFRFDFNGANTGGTGTGAGVFATGGRFASLAGSTAADNRRFFSSPDVALIRERGGKTYFTVSLGAGFRESPLNQDTNDRFYVLRDSNVYTVPTSYTSIVESDLTDVSSVNLSDAQATTILAQIATLEGQMATLNYALSSAQGNFNSYKTTIGHTDKQNAATQAYSDANGKQKLIDNILAADPYLLAHTPESAQQSTYQDSLTQARTVLANIEQARTDAQTVADATDAVALNSAYLLAQTAKDDALAAYTAAKTTSDADASLAATANATASAAEATATSAAATAAMAQAARDSADAAVTAATADAAATQLALNAANAAVPLVPSDVTAAQLAKDTADALVISTTTNATTKANELTTANAAKVSTETAAAALRNSSNTAAVTAAASATATATKLADSTTATASYTAAATAANNATTDDNAAFALTSLTAQMALEYEKLINLQGSLDSAYATVTSQETAIIAAKADPSFPSDNIPAMESQLAAMRANYAALDGVAKRTALNSGSPAEAIVRLNAVNSALAAGDASAKAAALQTALTALQASINLPGSATLTTATLIARDEASKSASLQSIANNEATTAALVANIQSQATALTATATALQAAADTLAAVTYDINSALLSPSQLTAARAQVAPAALTMFNAYQFLVDVALANASDTTTGLPKLRSDINIKYAALTPGDNYTPNIGLLEASKGFYLRLPKGEKVLSTSLSFRGSVFFSTFSPRGAAVATCGSDVGRGRTYAMSLIDASAIYVKDVSGTKTPIRSFDLKRSGIPPTPSVILSDGRPTVLTGTEVLREECVAGVEACRTNDAVKATYWREN
jgi:Tfp pilus tip-associated adhesin PilY1